jgi:Holliday junction DNA helicase RuvB
LRDRFGWSARLEYYPTADLQKILQRSARVLGVELLDEAQCEIAGRSRGTPRIANRLLRRVRDFADADRGPGSSVDQSCARYALERLDVDEAGFDGLDRLVMGTLLEKFDGGPVGIETLAAAVGEDRGTLEDVVEPYLIHQGFLNRTPRGRMATRIAREYFGVPHVDPRAKQPKLL